jgi:hypothetical protein
MFTSYSETRKAELVAKHTSWDIWFVYPLHGATTWHARPKGAPRATHSAGSADQLDALLSMQPQPEEARC